MDIQCPHCGTTCNAQQGDFGAFRRCSTCGQGFFINHAYICPKDGTITWYSSEELKNKSILGSMWWLIDSCGFGMAGYALLLALGGTEGYVDTTFIGIIINTFFSWQGITGLVLIALGRVMKAGSRPTCSKDDCECELLDLNSPMGWKIYMDLHE